MNRRLRKKWHLGEYQEFGFYVQFQVKPDPLDPGYSQFWDEFIFEGVEANSLGYTGYAGKKWHGFVVCLTPPKSKNRSDSVTPPSQHSALNNWLIAHPRVYDLHVGPLVDVWHDEKEANK